MSDYFNRTGNFLPLEQDVDEDEDDGEDSDRAYDQHVDDIITGLASNPCKHQDKEGDCMKSALKTRCWHVIRCPIRHSRKPQEQKADGVLK